VRDLAASDAERPDGELHDLLRARLAQRGASFYRELQSAAAGAPEREILDALWDLVWAGEVTNDTFAPLRALRWRRPTGERRPRPGRLHLGPPEAAGRWSLLEPSTGATATARLHSLATVMLDRHGILTREAVAAEEVSGGFSAVYPVLRAMEESGRIRRGYFVDRLGAAQFALPGAVDRLRALREEADVRSGGLTVYLLAAADPANPYGAALPWPRRGESDRRPLTRSAGAYVVLVGGQAVAYLERGGHSLQMLPAADDAESANAALGAFFELVQGGRFRELVITRVDGEPVASSPWRPLLEAGGFAAGYRGHVLRPRAPAG
jgi:ATP-dependent Lhr-like helicase